MRLLSNKDVRAKVLYSPAHIARLEAAGMSLYCTNVALSFKGDRIERGIEIELSVEEAASFDPADISPVSDTPAPEAEEKAETPLEEMSQAQLKERAKELGLAASGSKADLLERITLHLEAPAPEAEEDEITSE